MALSIGLSFCLDSFSLQPLLSTDRVITPGQELLFFNHCETGTLRYYLLYIERSLSCGKMSLPFYLKWDLWFKVRCTRKVHLTISWNLGVIFVSYQGLWDLFPSGGLF